MFAVSAAVSFSDRDEGGVPDYLKGARTMHPTRYSKETWASVSDSSVTSHHITSQPHPTENLLEGTAGLRCPPFLLDPF